MSSSAAAGSGNRWSPTWFRGRRDGFTVLELIIAAALLAAIMAVLLLITTRVLDAWTRAMGALSTSRTVRMGLDYLARDLEGAVFKDNGTAWLIIEPLAIGNGVEGSVWLRFFTSSSSERGGLSAVSYRLIDTNPANPASGEGKVIGLYRTAIDGERTFDEFLHELDEKAPGDFLDTASAREISSSFLGANVVSFRVDFWLREQGEKAGAWREFRLDPSVRASFPLYENGALLYLAPGFADIYLTVLSAEGVKMHEALERGVEIGMTRRELIERYGEVFSQRVSPIGRGFSN